MSKSSAYQSAKAPSTARTALIWKNCLAFRKETGSIIGFPGTSKHIGDARAALELECDILVPAALENQITEENAAGLKQKLSQKLQTDL
jgi:glutamate dehydrogenase/leucine dehydrogenase